MTVLKYTPDHDGMRQFGQSPELREAVLDAARAGAAAAQSADPAGRYEVDPMTLSAGRYDEPRVGAVITDTSSDSLRPDAVRALNTNAVIAIEGV